MSKMIIKELFLFPHYKIIVFNGDKNATYSVGNVGVATGHAIVTEFANLKHISVSSTRYKMLGNISRIKDSKCKVVFDEVRWLRDKYPNFTNPDGEKLDSPLDSIKSYLQAEGWTYPEAETWIIIPKPSKKLNGYHVDIEFEICPEDFGNGRFQKVLLPVYMTEIQSDTKEVEFNVEIPDFLYDFMVNHPDTEKRPKSKIITSGGFGYLHKALTDLSHDATMLVTLDKELSQAKKVILVSFGSSQKEVRDDWHFGYKGKKTNISFNYFIGHQMPATYFKSGKEVYVDKRYEQGKGFMPIKGRYVPVNHEHKIIAWTQEREDFLQTLETRFKTLSDNLNNFLSDMDENKLDQLVANGQKLLT
jgi:hypothetical protein